MRNFLYTENNIMLSSIGRKASLSHANSIHFFFFYVAPFCPIFSLFIIIIIICLNVRVRGGETRTAGSTLYILHANYTFKK